MFTQLISVKFIFTVFILQNLFYWASKKSKAPMLHVYYNVSVLQGVFTDGSLVPFQLSICCDIFSDIFKFIEYTADKAI